MKDSNRNRGGGVFLKKLQSSVDSIGNVRDAERNKLPVRGPTITQEALGLTQSPGHGHKREHTGDGSGSHSSAETARVSELLT